MGGLFGVVSNQDCVVDLFYGTDYHSHLGTKRGGLAVVNPDGFQRYIHSIENAQFRSKFETDINKMKGNMGIGVISDFEDQPLLIRSHLGDFALVTVGVIQNIDKLTAEAFKSRKSHFAEMRDGTINPTELVSMLINMGDSIEEGIQIAQDSIEGSCSMLILTEKGVYAARDKLGRTPIIIGKKNGSIAATLETCAFPNLDYETEYYLGPGEITFINEKGYVQKKPPGEKLQICSFLWVYYGYPASSYEGINVETIRNKCGEMLAKRDDCQIDSVAGMTELNERRFRVTRVNDTQLELRNENGKLHTAYSSAGTIKTGLITLQLAAADNPIVGSITAGDTETHEATFTITYGASLIHTHMEEIKVRSLTKIT